MPEDLWSDDEWRAAMSAADINDLPDSAFAYIEPGGEKDAEGKTTPRAKRHFPIHDAAHVRNALARAPQSPFGDKAMPAILAAAKKFGIKVSESKSADDEVDDAPFEPAAPGRVKKPRHRSGPATGLEVRHFASNLELRDDGSNNLQLVGTPIVYNTPYQVRDMFGTFQETMKPGVVSDLLANGCDTRFLFNHSGLPLARTVSGTLTLEDSPTGLRCVANLDARQQLATDLAVAVERGDVSQMSVGMIVGDDDWPDNETREINKLKALEDVSAVTYPASPTTDIAVAQRMLYEMPVESRERVRRMWAITRDLHDGRPVEPADIDVLSDGLRALAEADEIIETRVEDETDASLATDTGALAEALTHIANAERIAGDSPKWASLADIRTAIIDILTETRQAPTPQDKGIANKISIAHHAIADAINSQMKDPDNATDPVDSQVMGHLHDAAKSILKATGAQAVDGAPDIAPGTLAGPDSTIGVPSTASDGNSTSAAYDNTGIRDRLALEVELADMRRQRRARQSSSK